MNTLGGAIFEISQPQVACCKVGMRPNYPKMPLA